MNCAIILQPKGRMTGSDHCTSHKLLNVLAPVFVPTLNARTKWLKVTAHGINTLCKKVREMYSFFIEPQRCRSLTNTSAVACLIKALGVSLLILSVQSLGAGFTELKVVAEPCAMLGVIPREVWDLRDQAVWLSAFAHLVSDLPLFICLGIALGFATFGCSNFFQRNANSMLQVIAQTAKRYALFGLIGFLFWPVVTASYQALFLNFSIYRVMEMNAFCNPRSAVCSMLCLLFIDLCKCLWSSRVLNKPLLVAGVTLPH